MLLRRLTKHALGEIDMTPSQVAAAKILLGKVVPDVRQVEHSGTVNHVNYDVAVLGLINGDQPGNTRSPESSTH